MARPVLTRRVEVSIERIEASAYTVPTDAPGAARTFGWSSTTIVIVEIQAGGVRALGLAQEATPAQSCLRGRFNVSRAAPR